MLSVCRLLHTSEKSDFLYTGLLQYYRVRYELLLLNSMDFSTLIIGLIVSVTIRLPLCGLEMKDRVRRYTAQKQLISIFDAFTK